MGKGEIRNNVLNQKTSIIKYLVFGVLTTILNIFVYHVFFKIFGISNIASTCIAWLAAVLFAFLTNKLYVFCSQSWNKNAVKEFIHFVFCRSGTGIIEVLMMYIFVDILLCDGSVMKAITNIIVIFLNYFASKNFVFNSRRAS